TIVEAPATTKPAPPSAGPPAPTGVPNKTASVLDEQRLREFASAIQSQTFTIAGLTISVDTTNVDTVNKIVTAKITGAKSASGAAVADSQIVDALIVKGGGEARGVRPPNIRLTR
ncbi:MAG TPA: hypothetical protein VHV54_07320, partial [Candidatus Binatia bacterium]|nr:hypothetical protein [Candidatus Binatia bacterium]